MTSRREFFGLLAAAPLVAPAVVKEMVGQVQSSKLGIAGLDTASWKFYPGTEIDSARYLGPRYANALNYRVDGDLTTHFEMTPEQFDQFQEALDGQLEPNEALRKLMRGNSPWTIPNRLYGAQINADGEAV